MSPFSSSYPELTASQVGVPIEQKESAGIYDYIIVGGGTAGCVLASRLSEDPAVKVLLVERGILADNWVARVPLLSSDFRPENAPVLKWKTVPQKNANGQEFQIIAGKALGGTTRINSMLYTRGAPAEWNSWSAAGRKGWSYEEILPYFLKSEKASPKVPGDHHGRKGEWCVTALDGWSFSFWPRVIKAARSFGFSLVDDVNDPTGPILGCAKIHRTQEHGRRHATSFAFLPLELVSERKSRLHICTGTIATKIDFDTSQEIPRACGLFIQPEREGTGKTYYVKAKREIIVCSGTFGSPHVLLLSGIGPAEHLKEHGIPLVKDLRAVGENLMDHTGVPVSWKVPLKDSLHILQASIWAAIVQLFQYILYGTGLFCLPVSQVVLLVRSALLSSDSQLVPAAPEAGASRSKDLDAHDPANVVDLEIIPVPISLNPETVFTMKEGVFSFLCILVQPKSKGTVRLRSADPRARPLTDLGTFTAAEDVVTLRKGLKLVLALARTMKKQGWNDMQEYELPESEDDIKLDSFICRNAQTEYHYSSTCRMAPEADGGVVDDELRVHGIDGLRVADASIFPSILATHTQAPAVVVAEKCADMVKRTKAG